MSDSSTIFCLIEDDAESVCAPNSAHDRENHLWNKSLPKHTPDSLRLRSPSNNHFRLLKWTPSVWNVSCSHLAALKRKVAVSFASGVSMDVKLRSRLSRRSRINEREVPEFSHHRRHLRRFLKVAPVSGQNNKHPQTHRWQLPWGGPSNAASRQRQKPRHKFNGAQTGKIRVHLLDLLFVTAVGISLHHGPGLQCAASDPPPLQHKKKKKIHFVK